jgi:hypothetical protein
LTVYRQMITVFFNDQSSQQRGVGLWTHKLMELHGQLTRTDAGKNWECYGYFSFCSPVQLIGSKSAFGFIFILT